MTHLSVLLSLDIPMVFYVIMASLLSAFICGWGIPVIVRIAIIKGFVANPNGRTLHLQPVPNLGGVGLFAGITLSTLLFANFSADTDMRFVLASMIIIFFIGLKDDIYPLVPLKKIIGQFVAAGIIVVVGNTRITNLHGILGIGETGYIFSVVISILIVLTIINSYNFIDGVDGLSASSGIVASLFFTIWFSHTGHYSQAVFSGAILGALLVFFIFNVFGRRYKIFLGDSGAMLTGLLVATSAIWFCELSLVADPQYIISSVPGFVLCLLIVPFFDLLWVIIIRLSNGKSPFKADMNHIHHLLIEKSGSHIKVTMILIGINVLFIILGLALDSLGNRWVILIATMLALTFLIILSLIRRRYLKINNRV